MPKPQKSKANTKKKKKKKSEALLQPRKKRSKKKEEKCTSKEGKCRKHHQATHQLEEKLQREVGEENTKSNDLKFGKK